MEAVLKTKQDAIWSGEGDPAEIPELNQQLQALKDQQLELHDELEGVGNLETVKACLDLNLGRHRRFVFDLFSGDVGGGDRHISIGIGMLVLK